MLMPLRDAIEKPAHSVERLHVDDTTVPFAQAEELDVALQAAGVSHRMISVDHADHAFVSTGVPIDPSSAVIVLETSRFLADALT